ncbi:hypothetical protein FRZ61_18620 [Hypericibacter adhaerens]|jgi:proteasome lid subunit RPN8/RPN11|uniref:MPN domain-containing protein n=1 Tax=Hypericibacter adhaerens TaxID=2602016 RepID=A0A5J6MYA5_9PROT|nr:Mov34/MPN/PAD-1 family protein [Hypericibacter adhaerens]QEX21933.1 hypothetical protein FRZ61_18620 [Hypericibacter adhaerens]
MQWTEQEPDFTCVPQNAIFATLPFPLPLLLSLRVQAEPIVLLERSVAGAIKAHLHMRNEEMGGLLVGQVARHQNGSLLIRIDNHVEADDFDSSSVSLAMNPSVWNAARAKVVDFHYVIGWYHSHPNLGAFFSGTDRATQRHFFREPHSIGLVIDPIRDEEAWFIGEGSLSLQPMNIFRY